MFSGLKGSVLSYRDTLPVRMYPLLFFRLYRSLFSLSRIIFAAGTGVSGGSTLDTVHLIIFEWATAIGRSSRIL